MSQLKRVLCFVLLLALALSLCACGSKKAPDNQADASVSGVAGGSQGDAPAAQVPAPAETPASKNPPTSIEAGVPSDAHVATPAEIKAIAEAFIGRDVAELFEAIGDPLDTDYAPSCLVPGEAGEDGELFYDGFTVYTYRYNGVETVNGVR